MGLRTHVFTLTPQPARAGSRLPTTEPFAMQNLPRLAAFALVFMPLGLASVAQAQTTQPSRLTFEGDMVLGRACVLTSQFKHGQPVVWRVRVTDPKTGQQLDDKGLKSLVVEFSDGQKFPMRFHAHPPGSAPTDLFWVGTWTIPDSYPTGGFSYKILATDMDGKETEWQPFKVAASQFTVVSN